MDRTHKYSFYQSLYDGESFIYKLKEKHGEIFQFRMWIQSEGKDYRRSLRTKDYDIAFLKGKKLTKELMASGMTEQLVFSISVRELIEQYIAYRENDIDVATGITRKRWLTLSSQLKWFAFIVGEDTKLSDLKRDQLYEYSQLRNNARKCAMATVRIEKSTINHCIAFGYRNKLITHFDRFDFKQILIRQEAVGKRDTFTDKEYDKLTRYMKDKWTKIKNCEPTKTYQDFGTSFSKPAGTKIIVQKYHKGYKEERLVKQKKMVVFKTSEQELLERLMFRDLVLSQSNTCLRIGEAQQLKWKDILSYETHEVEDEYTKKTKENLLVEVRVRWETSKVKKNRIFFCRGGQFFKRLYERQEFTAPEDLVFSMDGTTALDHRVKRKHWIHLMEAIGIPNWYERKVTPYSLRHYGITQRVVSGVDIIDIAQMAGTSVKHIENTYLKYRKEQSRTAALKSYKKQEGKIKLIG